MIDHIQMSVRAMSVTKIIKYLNIIPTAAISLVLLIDIITFIRRNVIIIVPYIRELLIVISLLCIAFMIYRLQWLKKKPILFKVKLLALTIVGMYIGYFFPKIVLLSGHNQGTTGSEGYFASFNLLLYSTLTSVIIASLSILTLSILGYLIFVKRSKTTYRNFLLALIIMAAQFIYMHIIHVAGGKSINLASGGVVGMILVIALITSFVINSFRNTWINYLNRNQKFSLFFAGLLLVPASYGLINIPLNQVILAYSLSLGIIVMQTSLFTAIYVTFAELSLLFHLPTAGLHDIKDREINTYHKLSRSISMEFNPDKVVDQIIQQSLLVIGADANWLELIDPTTGKLEIVSSNDLSEFSREDMKAVEGGGIAEWVLKNRRYLLINDVTRDERTTVFSSLQRSIASVLAVPLIAYDKLLGILYAVKSQQYGFSDEHRDTLQAFADQAAIALENARLVKESIVKERLEQELKIAHDAQMKLLPKTMPRLPDYQIEAVCITANEVGGDYFDFFQLTRDRLGIVIGDVSGKGPEAAFLMAEVKGVVEALFRSHESPRDILIKTNKIMYDNLEREMFVTLSCGILDTKTNTLKFARAGHCPLVHYQDAENNVIIVEPRGIGVGLEQGYLFDSNIEESQINISPNDIILFYTDGVIEAKNPDSEEFGEGRLYEKVRQYKDDFAADIMRKIIQSINSFTGSAKPHDDLSMVLVKHDYNLQFKKNIDKINHS